MSDENQKRIERLQDNLLTLRKLVGWTTEELGNKIGVSKQTISNLETKKTPMSFVQYIALRAIFDFEMQNNQENHRLLHDIFHFLVDNDNLSEEDYKKLQLILSNISNVSSEATDIDTLTTVTGGMIKALGLVPAVVAGSAILGGPIVAAIGGTWLATLMKNTKK